MISYCKCQLCTEIKNKHKNNRHKSAEDIDKAIKNIIKYSSEYYIEIADGKYTVYQEKTGGLKALRYGKPWRDCCGDNLIGNLMYELIDAKEKIEVLLNELDDMDIDTNDKTFIKRTLKGE